MQKILKFNFTFGVLFLVVVNKLYFTFAKLDTPIKSPLPEIAIVNAFTSCNIRVINFRGLNFDFQIVNEPVLLIRYLSHCKKTLLYPFELGLAYPALNGLISSTCLNFKTDQPNLPSRELAIEYVVQTFKESYRMGSKNKICEADVYLYPPSEQSSPQLYMDDTNWAGVLKNPVALNLRLTYVNQKWKTNFINTVPMISLLICNSTADSISTNQNDVKKWIAGIFFFFEMVTLSVSVLIWEYPSASLKSLCPYCDPCDSFKTIPLNANIIPTSRNELETILQANQQINPNPHSVEVVLINYNVKDLRNYQIALKYIQKLQIDLVPWYIYVAADQHLTSLLLPKSANVTFSENQLNYAEWKNLVVDACSTTKPINSHPVFRPTISRTSARSHISLQENRLLIWTDQYRFVSYHKERAHWTNQLKELFSPFDLLTWLLILTICSIVSWIVNNSHCYSQKPGLFHLNFSTLCSILDQPNSLLKTQYKTPKCSYYWCVSLIPLSWLYLSVLYKGENVTRLTAEPPLIQFETFNLLEEYQFTAYSRRVNLETFNNAEKYNISELVKLHKEYGSVFFHESLPVVSELWLQLMDWFRPSSKFELSLNFLKNEIPKQMWSFLNNSAMLPDYGQGFWENVSTILNFHMKWCNKSAIILQRETAITLHSVLKQMGKPSFFGKDKILERFWGYQFEGNFPSKIIFRVRYLFEAGLFEWWRKYIDDSFVLKTNVHASILIPETNINNGTTEKGGGKTAVNILTLIPGVGLLFSLAVFTFVEIPFRITLGKHVLGVIFNCSSATMKQFHDIKRFGKKNKAQVQNVITINIQPKI